ncbi:MAG: tyrosine-type recombinase/integrase [Treponema sp.]
MIEEVCEEYLTYSAGIRRLSDNTVESYRSDMQLFSVWLKDSGLTFTEITRAHIRIFIADLANKHFAPSSINRTLSCVRGFYRYALRKGLCTVNPAAAVRNLKQPEKLPRFLFPDEAERFCAFPKEAGILWYARDAALFSSLYSTGCRVSELHGLTVQDIRGNGSWAIVKGKGSKERKVFFADFAQEALQRYLTERTALLEQRQQGSLKKAQGEEQALFLNCRGGALTTQGIRYIINRYTALLPNYKKLTPHAFRHSFASLFVTRGADIRVVQELLGHSSIETTQRYTHITAAQLQELYHRAHPHG